MKKYTYLFIGTLLLFFLSFTSASAQVFSNSYQLITGTNTGVGTNAPTVRLDVNGQARIRTINQDEQLRRVLVADNNGVVHWRDAAALPGADNDWFFNGPNILFNNTATRVGVGNQNPANGSLLHVGTGPGNSLLRIGSVERISDVGSNTMELGQCDVVPSADCAWDLGQANGRRWDRLFACRGVFQNLAPTGGDGLEKARVMELDYGMSEIMRLETNSFVCLDCDDNGTRLGLNAASLKKVVPEAVYDPSEEIRFDEDGNPMVMEGDMMVNYGALVPVLVNALQEQQERIEQDAKNTEVMMEKLEAMQREMEEMRAEMNSAKPLQLNEEGLLFQNQPNPFDGEATIRYFVPTNSNSAELVFHGMDGKVVHRIALEANGMGSATINSNDIPADGISFYTLVIDGEKVDTRRILQISTK